MGQAFRPSETIALTFKDHVKRVYASVLLLTYGIFLCSYFIFDEYSDPYRFFTRVLFVLGLFVIDQGIRDTWRHPLFFAITGYMVYLLLSGFWSDPFDWYRLGQKFSICLYLFGFIAITRFLVNWNRDWFERMLSVCTLFAAMAAIVTIIVFYNDHPFPATRLGGIGSLTNINEFANVYGVFAILAMFLAIRNPQLPLKSIFLLAVGAFICVAWFGQSRSAFTSVTISLLALAGFMLEERRVLFAIIVAALLAALVLVFPDVLDQAFLRGQGLRPLIWAGIWDEATTAPIFGNGFTSLMSVEAGKRTIETSHNAFLQVFWQGGATGLLIFLLLLVVAFHSAWSWGRQQGDYSIFCVLLFATGTMVTGVDSLIDRPRDQWMLFWFPLALLLSFQCTTATARIRSTRPATQQAND